MELAPLLELGKTTKVISDRAFQLCSVVRNYRNLIHAGRLRRLAEKVDERGARIALELVRLITSEVRENKVQLYGERAEEVVQMLFQDPLIHVIPETLRKLHEREKERLLMGELVKAYLSTQTSMEDTQPVEAALQECFRLLFTAADYTLRQKVVGWYYTLLTKGERRQREAYEYCFLHADQLQHLPDLMKRQVVKRHILHLYKTSPKWFYHDLASGIGPFLTPEDIPLFVESCLTVPWSEDWDVAEMEGLVQAWLPQEVNTMSPYMRRVLKEQLRLVGETNASLHAMYEIVELADF
jgi:hypothetical protein